MRTLLAFLLFAASAVAQTVGIGAGIPSGEVYYTNNAGAPLAGGKVCTYGAGGSTPQTTWSDSQLTTPNANPVVLNSSGRASIWLNSASYKIVLRGVGADGTCSTGTILWTQDNVSSPTPSINGGIVNALAYGVLCDGSTDDQAAFATAIATGYNVLLPGNRTCLVGSPGLTINTNQQSLLCQTGAVLKVKSGFTGTLFTISSSTDNSIENCTFDGNAQGVNTGSILELTSATRADIHGMYFKGAAAGQYSIHGTGVVYSRIAGNKFLDGGNSISLQDSSNHDVIQGNDINETSSGSATKSLSAIALQLGTSESNTIHDITVSGNTIKEQFHFCGEAGNFVSGGMHLTTQVYGITFTGNTCEIANSAGSAACGMASGAACGGFSLSTISNSAVVGNTYYAAGQVASIAAVEMTDCYGCTASSNVIVGDTSSAIAQGSRGISSNCQACAITGNQITNVSTGATGFIGGIDHHTTSTYGTADDTTITGNTIVLGSGAVSATAGIYINCNNASGSLTGITVTGNTIVGPGSSGQGIWAQQNSGTCTLDSPVITGNFMASLANGVNVNTGAVTNVMAYPNQFLSVTTAILTGGSTTFGQSTVKNVIREVTGMMVGEDVAPTQKLDVHGTSSFTDTMCLSPNHTCNSGSSGNTSPLLEWDAPGNARFRIGVTGGNKINLNSADNVNLGIQTSGTDRLLMDVAHGLWTFQYKPQLPAAAFGGLPACSSTYEGAMVVVTDSTTNTWGGTITGGSGDVVLAWCNGTNWTVAGK